MKRFLGAAFAAVIVLLLAPVAASAQVETTSTEMEINGCLVLYTSSTYTKATRVSPCNNVRVRQQRYYAGSIRTYYGAWAGLGANVSSSSVFATDGTFVRGQYQLYSTTNPWVTIPKS